MLKVFIAKQQTTQNEHKYPKSVASVMHCASVRGGVHAVRVEWLSKEILSTLFSSAGLGQALIGSGWMMLAVLGVNHVFSPAEIGGLDRITVSILKMWQFSVLVVVLLVPETAALLLQLEPILLQLQTIQV